MGPGPRSGAAAPSLGAFEGLARHLWHATNLPQGWPWVESTEFRNGWEHPNLRLYYEDGR